MLASKIRTELSSWSCSQAVSKSVWHTIAVFIAKNSWWWTEELSETCSFIPKKNKAEKLVHLFGFIIRIYQDARSAERQNPVTKAKEIRTSDVANMAPARQIYSPSSPPIHAPTSRAYPQHATDTVHLRSSAEEFGRDKSLPWASALDSVTRDSLRGAKWVSPGTATEARGKPQRCFVRDLNGAAQPELPSSSSSIIFKRTWIAKKCNFTHKRINIQ